MEGLEDAEVVKVGMGINKIAGQGSGGGVGGVSSSYRPTRRGSPRPNTHNHFDINEHLPWMIVLLLLLVLVVIVVCSVKRSSRVLKKGPMQDPSSIMEKAIQKKPSVPPMQVKEKWIYYSNGQGESTVSFVSNRLVLESRTLFWHRLKWLTDFLGHHQPAQSASLASLLLIIDSSSLRNTNGGLNVISPNGVPLMIMLECVAPKSPIGVQWGSKSAYCEDQSVSILHLTFNLSATYTKMTDPVSRSLFINGVTQMLPR